MDIGILSQHYAGLAFDVGQNLNNQERAQMRTLAVNSGIWNYVEPVSETPRWVHFDERQVASGYPVIRQGSRGVYVCIAQDGLTTLGYDTGGLDGIFGNKTNIAVRSFQAQNGLSQDGIIGRLTWNNLMNQIVGKGPSDNSILVN